MVACSFRSHRLSWALLWRLQSAAHSALAWSAPLQPPLPVRPLLRPALQAPLLVSSLLGVAAPVHSQQASSPVAGPSLLCLGGGQLHHTHPWQQMHGASPGVVDAPPADPWIECSYCGDPVCVHDCGADELSELGAMSQTGPPLRAWLDPGRLRQRALAAGPIAGAAGQLPDLPLRAPLGQPQVPNRLSLSVGSPLAPWGLGTTMGFIPRILRKLFKPQTALPSAMQQCPGLCV